ncbi:hypothetical protein VaNZ11_003423 [Volvox africanus]|uniref:Uncharacterized protein n=1 Tax=Volvox africanus TaxID=51714 RepID=A0ABQ5RU90_9CHLO|nr:hypothetical protein VaNZ11_003423 [Volvox africanus]
MLQTRNSVSIGRNCILQSGRPFARPQRKLLALQVAASVRWKFKSIFDSIRRKPLKQQSQKSATIPGPHGLVGKQQASVALPPTFQRLSPGLIVLLDPKHDRLVYLLSINDAATTDAVTAQLQSLLQAAAAPYVHLMGLPAGLRAGLVREFPGGQPIITNVSLPADLATVFQQQQQERLRCCSDYQGSHSNSRSGEPALAQEAQVTASDRWARGGVLELLFGSAKLQHAGPAEGSTMTGGEVEAGHGGDKYDRDLPDEVISRRKTVKRLMSWRKGASMRVARRRSERTPYKHDWLIQGFNTLDRLSVVVATPNLILIRNNVNANLRIDIYYQREDQESDKGERVDGTRTVELQAQGPEVLPEGLSQILKAVGILNSNSENEGDNNRGDDEEAEDLVAILSMLAEGSDDDQDKDDASEKLEGGKEEEQEEEGIADGLTLRSLAASDGRGQFREILPGVFVRMVDAGIPRTGSDDDDQESAGNSDDEDGELDWDTANTLDMQLSPGPMGWTASVRVGRHAGDTIAQHRATLESLAAETEYIRNMRRLEALWGKQSQERILRQGQGDQERGAAGTQAPSAAGEEGASSRLTDEDPDGLGSVQGLEGGWQRAERRAAGDVWGNLTLPPGSGVGAAAAAGAVPTDHLMRPPRRPGAGAAVDSFAASASAADAEGDGVSEGPGNGRIVGQEDESSAAASAAAEASLPHSTHPTGPSQPGTPLIRPFTLSAAPLDADGFVGSTRMRRGAVDEAQGGSNSTSVAGDPVASGTQIDGSESSGEGTEEWEGHVRHTGPSRMVRRPRGRMRLSRQLPSVSGPDAETGTTENTEASAALPSSSAPSAPFLIPNEDIAGQGAADPASTVSNDNDVVAIPAYRHIRHNGGSAGTGASAAPGTGSVADTDAGSGVNAVSRTPWTGRIGPAAPTPQSTGSGATGLPPEAAGYPLDLEQLAHFVLGRQASPEEVQDLARAVAQSAEVEEAFGGITGGQLHPLQQHEQQQQQHGPLGFGPQSHPWRRPGTQPPSLREALNGVSRSRRSVVTPRRRRLRIPAQVLQLAAARWPHGSQNLLGQAEQGMRLDAIGPVGLDPDMVPESSAERKLLSSLMLRRLGQRREAEPSLSEVRAPADADSQRVLQQDAASQEEITTLMLDAYRAAPPLERHAAEVLVDFLHGRRDLGHHADGSRCLEGAKRCNTGGFWSRTGMHGLVRGRDAVVLLPRSLLEATVGAWQEQEQRLMHEDYRVGLGHA